MSTKKIVIVFENHREGIESLSFNLLLQQLNQKRVTDLVLEDTKEETFDSLLRKYQVILDNPNTYSKYIKGQHDILLSAKNNGIKIHAADVPEKEFNKYKESNDIIINKIINSFSQFVIREALGEEGIQLLRQSNPHITDIGILISGFIQQNSVALWEDFSKTAEFKNYIDEDIAHPMISKRDANFAKNIDEIAKSSAGTVLVQLGSRHANVINLLREKGYVNIIPLLIDLGIEDFDGMALNYHLEKLNFSSRFIITSNEKKAKNLSNEMMAKIKSLAVENLQNFANSIVNLKVPSTEVSGEWYSEDTITTLLQSSLSNQELYYISPQTQFEHNDLLSANLAQVLANVIDGRIAVMPVNIHNNHWISIVMMQQRDGAIQVIINDPMGNSIQQESNASLLVQIITNLVHDFAGDRALNIIDLVLQQQATDDYVNCGPITVENLRLLALAADRLDNLTQEQIIEEAGLNSVNGKNARINHNRILGNSLESTVEDQLELGDIGIMGSMMPDGSATIAIAGLLAMFAFCSSDNIN